MLKKMRKKKGQSTLEYIILLAALISGLIIFLAGSNSPFMRSVNSTYGQVLNGMEGQANSIVTSWGDE